MAEQTKIKQDDDIVHDITQMGFKKADVLQAIEDINLRMLWKIDAFVLIYSRQKEKWFNGQIIDSFVDQETNEQWFRIRYDDKNAKKIQRFSENIKPIDIAQDHNSNPSIMQIICEKLKLNQITAHQLELNSDGILYWYWPYYEPLLFDESKQYDTNQLTINGIYIEQKYANLKEECLASECGINVERWQQILQKATVMTANDRAKEIKSANRNCELHYGIIRGSSLCIENMSVICMYCDFTEFGRKYKSTFRPHEKNETISSIVKRHQSFRLYSKILRETVQYFGDNTYSHSAGPFYFGHSNEMSFDRFSMLFNVPRSVTRQYDISLRFAGGNASIVVLQNDGDYESRNHLRFFNVSWISDFAEEEERLFFDPGMALRMVTVKVFRDGRCDNFEPYFEAFYLLDCMLSGNNMEGVRIKLKKRHHRFLLDLFATMHEVNDRIPQYIHGAFASFRANRTRIAVNIHMLDLYFKDLSDIIYGSVMQDDDHRTREADTNVIKQNIMQLFTELQQFTVITTSLDGSSSYTFSLETLLSRLCDCCLLFLHTVVIKAWWDKDNVFSNNQAQSWISNVWKKQRKELLQMYGVKGWKIELQQDTNMKQDQLIIKKRMKALQNNVNDEEMKQNNAEIECFCTFSEKCGFIKRLILCVKRYNKVKNESMEELDDFFHSDACKHILNDYIHLVHVHHHQMHEICEESKQNDVICELDKKCSIKRSRDLKQRKLRNDGTSAAFYPQLFETIHYYLFHLVDSRSNNDDIHDNVVDDNDSKEEQPIITNKFSMQIAITHEETGSKLLGMYRYLHKHKAMNVEEMKQLHSFLEEEHFDSDTIREDLKNNPSNIAMKVSKKMLFVMRRYVLNNKVTSASFDTGLIFYYWPYYQALDDTNTEQMEDESNINDHGGHQVYELYIKSPKYASIKEEILHYNNAPKELFDPSVFNPIIFELVYDKAMKYINTESVRSMTAIHQNHLHYDIKPGTGLAVKNLMALSVYCDFTHLCTRFSATFRANSARESLKFIKARNSSYWWLSKTLRETVQLFGSNRYKEHGPFYTGMDFMMYLYQFNIRLCGPNSTTTDKQETVKFHKNQGILIQFNNNGDAYNCKRLRFFNCKWISDYPQEEERLFFGGDFRIRIESVTVTTTNTNFKKYFHALYLFDCMLTASNMKGCKVLINGTDKEILDALIEYELGIAPEKAYDEYIHHTFHAFCIKKASIVINLNQLDWYFKRYKLFKFIADAVDDSFAKREKSHSNILNANVFKLFENATQIKIYTTDKRGLTSYSFDLESFLSTARESWFWRKIEIKGVHDNDDVHRYKSQRSWIFESYSDFVNDETYNNWKQYEMICNETTASNGNKEDSLTIKPFFKK